MADSGAAISDNARALIYDTADGFWSAPAGVGTPAVITYSFLDAPTAQVSASDFSPFQEGLKTTTRQVLQTVADLIGVTFIEVPASAPGELRFGFDATMDSGTVGYAFYPVVLPDGEASASGDIYLLTSRYSHLTVAAAGSSVFEVLLHEVGHALGLKHPFDGDPMLDPQFDNTDYTVMSYTHLSPPKPTLQSLDVEALRHLYGSSEAAAADGVTVSFDQEALRLTTISGNASDRAVGINLADRMLGGQGDDSLWGERGADTLDGGRGNDLLHGGFSSDLIYGGYGDDLLDAGSSGEDVLYGGAGNDTYVITHSGVAVVDDEGAADTLQADFSYTLPDAVENLVLTGSAFRGTGNSADNLVDGNAEGNLLDGAAGADYIRGLDGGDEIEGGAGADSGFGNRGDDTLYGEDGADYMLGGQEADRIYGGLGDDVVNGNKQADIVYGDDGDDQVFGGQDDDVLFGGAGNDLLTGDLGNDTLTGGTGADRFVLRTGAGTDQVQDFSFAQGDRIQIAAGLTYSVDGTIGSARLVLSDGASLLLTGVAAADVQASWVVSG